MSMRRPADTHNRSKSTVSQTFMQPPSVLPVRVSILTFDGCRAFVLASRIESDTNAWSPTTTIVCTSSMSNASDSEDHWRSDRSEARSSRFLGGHPRMINRESSRRGVTRRGVARVTVGCFVQISLRYGGEALSHHHNNRDGKHDTVVKLSMCGTRRASRETSPMKRSGRCAITSAKKKNTHAVPAIQRFLVERLGQRDRRFRRTRGSATLPARLGLTPVYRETHRRNWLGCRSDQNYRSRVLRGRSQRRSCRGR